MRIALYWITGLLAIAALGFLINLLAFGQYAFFQPKITAVQNQTFHASQQYTDGKLNALRDYEIQYRNANTSEQKESIKALVQDEFSSYDQQNLSGHPELARFLEEMMSSS